MFVTRFPLDINETSLFDFRYFIKKPKLLCGCIPIDIHAKEQCSTRAENDGEYHFEGTESQKRDSVDAGRLLSVVEVLKLY